MIIESQKLNDWKPRLRTLIVERAKVPFEWGKNDCVSFAADVIEAMTGMDVIDWGRGKYSNKEEALMVLKDHFGVGVFKTFDRIFEEHGFTQTDSIKGGDIAFVVIENLDPEASEMFNHLTLMVGVGDGAITGPGKDGLVLIKKYELVKAWTL